MAADSSIVPFLTPSYTLPSKNASDRSSVNVYLQNGENLAKNEYVGIGTPGTALWQSLDHISSVGRGCRGLYYASREILYAVYGPCVYKITYSDTLGTYVTNMIYLIPDGPDRVSMTDNGRYIILVDGSGMYIIHMDTDVVQTPQNLPFEFPIQVEYVSQRVYCIVADDTPTSNLTQSAIKRNQIWWSELGLDGCLTWDGLAYASAESNADPIIRIAKRQGDLWLYGPRSYEIWTATNNPDIPLAYSSGTGSEIGCMAPYSVCAIGENVFWLGSSVAGKDIVFMSSSTSSMRISDHAVEMSINTAGLATRTAVAWAYQQAGHTFYVLTIPAVVGNPYSDRTLVYDLSTKVWHERSSRNPATNTMHAWEPMLGAYAFNKVICGNITNPVLLDLDAQTYTDWAPVSTLTPNGTKPILRTMIGPQYYADFRLMSHIEFRLDMQGGVGHPQNAPDPQIMMAFSDDGGYTWSNEDWSPLGNSGEYATQVRWRFLGSSRQRVYRISCSDPIMFYILGARVVTEKAGLM